MWLLYTRAGGANCTCLDLCRALPLRACGPPPSLESGPDDGWGKMADLGSMVDVMRDGDWRVLVL